MHINRIAALTMVAGICFTSTAWAAGEDEQPTARIIMTESAPVPAATRPAVLPALYVSLGAMQAWDLYSTSAALKAGAREASPSAAPFANNRGSMLGLKLATTASTIFFTERMWRKNRVAAVAMMVAINAGTAAVSIHNLQNARAASRR